MPSHRNWRQLGRRLTSLPTTAPWLPIAVLYLLGALAAWRATHLHLRPELWELLPENQPSVIELHRVLGRTRGLSNVFVVIEGADGARLRRFGDALFCELIVFPETEDYVKKIIAVRSAYRELAPRLAEGDGTPP